MWPDYPYSVLLDSDERGVRVDFRRLRDKKSREKVINRLNSLVPQLEDNEALATSLSKVVNLTKVRIEGDDDTLPLLGEGSMSHRSVLVKSLARCLDA
jgi:hypothetical protein